jgi:cytochrome b561
MIQIDDAAKAPAANSDDRKAPWTNGVWGFGNLSRLLHWTTAVLIFALVGLGLYSKGIPDGSWRDVEVGLHKSLGLLVILLTAFRLAWMAYYPSEADHGHLKPWERAATRVGHTLLYTLLLLMPLSGLLMSEGAGRYTSFFGLFDVPPVLPMDPGVAPRQQHYYKLGKWLHDWPFQWALYGVFALHILGVIKHQSLDGDRGFIRGMWGRAKPPG